MSIATPTVTSIAGGIGVNSITQTGIAAKGVVFSDKPNPFVNTLAPAFGPGPVRRSEKGSIR